MARWGGAKILQKEKQGTGLWLVPVTVVGAVITAALMVLLLLSKSQLSQMGFAISALERELEQLQIQRDKLLIERTEAYSLVRVEQYAKEKLGMVHPNPDQYRLIDIAYELSTGSTIQRDTGS